MALSGKDGKITYSGADYEVVDWSLDISTDMVDTSMTGSDWKAVLDGQSGATGSITVRVDDTGYGALIALGIPPLTAAAITFDIDATHKFSATTAFLSGMSPSLSASGSVDMTFDFTVSGALTYA